MLQFDKAAVEIFGVQEQDRLAMGANLRLAIAQHTGAFALELVAGGENVINLETDVMHAAIGIFFEKFGDGRTGAQRLQQFNLGVGQFDKHHGDAMGGLRKRPGHFRAKAVTVFGAGGGDIRDGDRDMIETADHGCFLSFRRQNDSI